MAETLNRRRKLTTEERANEAWLMRFVAETAHDSGSTARTHASRIRAALRRYNEEEGRTPTLHEAFTDAAVLGKILRCDRALSGGGQIGRSTVNATRDSFRSFAAWLPPDGEPSRFQARKTLDEARRLSTKARGLRRMTVAGRAPEPDLRHVPSEAEINAVIECLRGNGSGAAAATADVIAFCYATGARIEAVLSLKRSDLVRYPDTRQWIALREKSRPDSRQVEVRGERAGLLAEWEVLAAGDSLWMVHGSALSYRTAQAWLNRAIAASGVPFFSFHRLRHSFATRVAVYMGLNGVMLAGGWLAEPVAQTYVHAAEIT